MALQINNSIVGITGEEQIYKVNVQAYPGNQYIEEGMKYIADHCRFRPIIYFGPKFDVDKRFGLPKNEFVRWVDYNDDEALVAV